MRVLVTGGTGVIGWSAATALLQRGHSVRLLSRHAAEDATQWTQGVTPWPGDVAVEATVRGAADECDAVLHIAGIADESPPEATFERVNVDGTRHMLAEAERAGARRFVLVSSLGAEHGDSAYHRSKRAAEELVRKFSGDWLVVRPGAAYGPGDAHLSVLLRMVRSMPVVPLIGDGEQQFQPIWHEDLAEALATAVERTDISGRALDVAGPELTSQKDLMDRLRALTDRHPAVVPIPEFLTSFGIKALETFGVDVPFTEDQLTMLGEGNRIVNGGENALTTVFGVRPTPLEQGLRRLLDEQPPQLPDDGVGTLQHKRYWADIANGRFNAPALMDIVKHRFGELLPGLVDGKAEPSTEITIAAGETLTLGLPVRGHIQVRVVDVQPTQFTVLTMEGHPIAGAVRFLAETRGEAVRFEIEVFERAANVVDLLMIRTLGQLLQDANWVQMVRNVVDASGGTTGKVERDSANLDEQQAERVEEWLRAFALEMKRDEAGV